MEPSGHENGTSTPEIKGVDASCSMRSSFEFSSIKFPRTEQVVMRLSGPPLDEATAQRIERRGGVCWANYYPGTIDKVVVGSDQRNYATHAQVHDGLREEMRREANRYSDVSITALENSRVDGFKDGNNYVVRIEDHSPLLKAAGVDGGPGNLIARIELDALLAKYNRAIEIAGIACQDCGGEVLLQAEGAAQITIAKMLGRLHQATVQEDMSGLFLAKARQETSAGTFYYSRTNGTRYMMPDQFDAIKSMVDDREKFIAGLHQMHKWMITDNQRGSREAQFFIVSPETRELVNRGPAIDKMILHLEDLIATCESIGDEWAEYSGLVRDLIGDMAEYQRSLTHPDFRKDELKSAIYVQKVSDILKRGGEGLSLGPEFSTPLEALEIGHFRRYSDGTREFVHSTSDGEHELLISWVQREFPETAQADWLCLCKPRIPLTFEHHPKTFVRSFGASEDDSFVVLFGRLGEPERRLVVRRNSYAQNSWEARDTTRMAELREEYSPEFLTNAVHLFQSSQYQLAHKLWELSGSEHSQVPDMFKPIHVDLERGKFGDYEYRPFYDGKRVDLESLMTWSQERIMGALACVGEIMAVAFISQAPVLSQSGLVITSETEKAEIPLKMMPLSESETFCHSLGIKSRKSYLETVPTLYGAHIAVWVESFLQGEFCKPPLVNPRQVGGLRHKLINHCLAHFEKSYLAISQGGHSPFREECNKVRDLYAAKVEAEGELPPELDMRGSLGLSEQLSELTPSQIASVKSRIKGEAFGYCKVIRNALYEGGEESSSSKVKEAVVDSVFSLVSNHFSEASRFNSILTLLRRDDSNHGPASYTLKEKLWLYTIVDVGAWLSEIGKSEKSTSLLRSAVASENVEIFLSQSSVFSGLSLPRQTLIRFYEAVEGLRKEMKGLESEHPKRIQLQRDIGNAFALRGMNSKI